ncbi:formimidoylglutamase [Brumimicrobium mesophilum]|uniref:formimidoylglutamase n=1 Tax=Brumimicrobium mesophilum TaxID=392717 RepID=UPI000D143C2A|nr:formimidoylglutamase [Brumimicrobium mesophilum]
MRSNFQTFELLKFTKTDIKKCISPREGETKLGQVINNSENAKYVILGIEESIGPKANNGRDGAENGFKSFLNAFLNMQSNESLEGGEISVLGRVVQRIEIGEELSKAVEELDEFVFDILNEFLAAGQIPIVIGGGHNNAFPLIKFSAHRFSSAVNVVNLDAHADYRLLEGRHSGNPFSYAFNQKALNKYHVFGLHQRYNSQRILDDLRHDGHTFTFNEDYLLINRNYLQDFKDVQTKMQHQKEYLGIELDLDVIERMPTSAFSPVGISIQTCRQYIRVFAESDHVAYLHLPEGAPKNEEEERIVGKTLAYFVSDFIIAHG